MNRYFLLTDEENAPWDGEAFFILLWCGIILMRYIILIIIKKIKNRNKYVREWKDGEPNGQGTETYPDGRKKVGYWIDGVFQN